MVKTLKSSFPIAYETENKNIQVQFPTKVICKAQMARIVHTLSWRVHSLKQLQACQSYSQALAMESHQEKACSTDHAAHSLKSGYCPRPQHPPHTWHAKNKHAPFRNFIHILKQLSKTGPSSFLQTLVMCNIQKSQTCIDYCPCVGLCWHYCPQSIVKVLRSIEKPLLS